MNFLQRIFGTKEKEDAPVIKEAVTPYTNSRGNGNAYVVDPWRYKQILSMLDGLIHPSVVGNNFLELREVRMMPICIPRSNRNMQSDGTFT